MAEEQAKAGIKNQKIGQVVSTKMQKTIVVEVSRRVPHPLYKRIIGKRKKFYAHDEQGTARTGDVCLLYTSPSPRDYAASRMPSSA